jgi:hypothetical protein
MQISDNVAYIRICQWLAMAYLPPVGMTKVRTASDHNCPQTLITDESEIAGVGDVLVILVMARSAALSKCFTAVINISRCV